MSREFGERGFIEKSAYTLRNILAGLGIILGVFGYLGNATAAFVGAFASHELANRSAKKR